VTCAFYDAKAPSSNADPLPHCDSKQLVACLFTTHDLLDNGTWPVIGFSDPTMPPQFLPFEDTRERGWVGAKVYGSGIVMEFLNAYFGLAMWDDWADPSYLDKLLIHPSKKPANVRLKKDG
jgi:hypothetical protein